MNTFEIGKTGEAVAKRYLEDSGFIIRNRGDENNACPYDILCEKDDALYAINVKTVSSAKGVFVLQLSNIPRLLKFCKGNKAIPAYLLVYQDKFVFLGLQDAFSDWSMKVDHHNWRAKIISRNRITIPLFIVEQWGLKEGDEIHVFVKRATRPIKDVII